MLFNCTDAADFPEAQTDDPIKCNIIYTITTENVATVDTQSLERKVIKGLIV